MCLNNTPKLEFIFGMNKRMWHFACRFFMLLTLQLGILLCASFAASHPFALSPAPSLCHSLVRQLGGGSAFRASLALLTYVCYSRH